MEKDILKTITKSEVFIEFGKNDKDLKKNSEILFYYDTLIEQCRLSSDQLKEESKHLNPFYCPKLFKLIDDRLHLMPLWCGIMIRITGLSLKNPYLCSITRLSNNYVENYFGHIKTYIFKNKKQSTSELTTVLYRRLQSKFKQHYNSLNTKLEAKNKSNKNGKLKIS
jgi:hypothetical protein